LAREGASLYTGQLAQACAALLRVRENKAEGARSFGMAAFVCENTGSAARLLVTSARPLFGGTTGGSENKKRFYRGFSKMAFLKFVFV
jgi:hypothetical protein